MISIPQEHYNKLLSLITSMHTNFSLLLHSQSKQSMQKLVDQFTSLNQSLKTNIDSVNNQSQHHKIVLLQYESQLSLLRHKYQSQLETVKTSETQATKLRQQLSKVQKEHQKLKEQNKQLKQELVNKENSIKQIQEQVKSHIKTVKKEYKEENKELKERVKKLQALLATAIVTNNNHQVQLELDKQLEELKNFKLQ